MPGLRVNRLLDWKRRFAWVALVLAACVPPGVVLSEIATRGVNVPFADQWLRGSTLDVASRTLTGTLSRRDLLRQNFDHRIFFSHLTTAVLVRFSSWDQRDEMRLSVLMAAVAVVLLFVAWKKGAPPHALPWVLPVFSLLMLSQRQRANWLWGFQTQWYFALLFVAALAALLSVSRLRTRHWVLGAIGATCATFSFGSGLLTWPLFVLGAVLRGEMTWRRAIGWLVAAVTVLVVFFQRYNWMPRPGRPLSLSWALDTAQFVFAFVGSSFAPESAAGLPWAMAAGVVVLALALLATLLLWRGGALRESVPWLFLLGFAVGSALMASQSERGRAVANALFSRNVAHACLAAVAALVLTGQAAKRLSPSKAWLLRLAPALWIPGFVWATQASWTPYPFIGDRALFDCVQAFPKLRNLSCLGVTGEFVEDADNVSKTLLLLSEHRKGPYAEGR
ncbi:MAG: hypothetical protein ACKVPX_07135 [Myxococcaceae bacterium]